jgi:hypothetical protein
MQSILYLLVKWSPRRNLRRRERDGTYASLWLEQGFFRTLLWL